MRLPAALIALTLSEAAAANAARADENSADLRCLIAAAAMAQQAAAAQKGTFTAVAVYYLGKLDGRRPGLDLEARVTEEVKAMAPQDYGPELARCGGEVRERGAAVTAMGARLREKAGTPGG